MRFSQFQERIIDDAIAAAHAAYQEPRRSGFIAGVESCRNKGFADLADELVAANTAAHAATEAKHPREEDALAYRAGVEWVCDCMSVIMKNQGMKPIVEPSKQAWVKAVSLTTREYGRATVTSGLPQ